MKDQVIMHSKKRNGNKVVMHSVNIFFGIMHDHLVLNTVLMHDPGRKMQFLGDHSPFLPMLHRP